MTPAHCFKSRSLILATVLVCGLGLFTHANAQVNPTHAFLVDLNSRSATDLDTLGNFSYPSGINDAGQVVGHSAGHAFITGPDGMGMRDLGSLGESWSVASGVNDTGQVVGSSQTGDALSPVHAFVTGPDGVGMRDLGTLGGFPDYSEARGINERGQVVGGSSTAGGDFHAFITGPNGVGMRDLGTLGGSHSWAYGINDAGQVVGVSTTAEGFSHAFITGPDGMGMRDLGTISGHISEAYGINDVGQVVGVDYTTEGDPRAFITGPDGMDPKDLNSLIDLSQGVVLTWASDINNNGQVAATGVIPEPETYALLLAGLSLIGFVARRKKAEARI